MIPHGTITHQAVSPLLDRRMGHSRSKRWQQYRHGLSRQRLLQSMSVQSTQPDLTISEERVFAADRTPSRHVRQCRLQGHASHGILCILRNLRKRHEDAREVESRSIRDVLIYHILAVLDRLDKPTSRREIYQRGRPGR